jgi:hypothetical protein
MKHMEGITNASQLMVKEEEEEEEKVMDIDNKECKVKQRLLSENRDGSVPRRLFIPALQ